MGIEEKVKAKTSKAKKSSKRKTTELDANTSRNAMVGIGTDALEDINNSSDLENNKKMKKEKVVISKTKSRHFENDLLEYLSNWERKETIPWKFNKVLQAWALANVFDKEKIGSNAFKQLCPYLKTVQGGARTRLVEEVNKVISDAESQVEGGAEDGEGGNEGEREGVVSEKVLKRAIKLKKLFEN
jgi:hypothetical protein